MTAAIVRLRRERLLQEYGLRTQRLQPWAVLNAPFEGSWAIAEPHSASTLHAHHEHEIFIAVSGRAIVECDGEQSPFESGDIAFFRPGRQHRLRNDSDDEFVFYSVWWDEEMANRFLAGSRPEVSR